MTAIATRADIMQRLAQGKGAVRPFVTTYAAGTAAAATSGFLSCGVLFASPLTTLPATRDGFDKAFPPASAELMLTEFSACVNGAGRGGWLGRFYELGTLDVTADGDKFTHASTFTKLTRTQFGVAADPISMIPVFYVTTAFTVAAPTVRFDTALGGSGYKNQDGTSVVGLIDFVFPSATTVASSTYVPMLEPGDSGIQDILAIEVRTGTHATAGAVQVFGFEPLAPLAGFGTSTLSILDGVFSSFGMLDLEPAVPDSGSVVSAVGILSLSNGGGTVLSGKAIAVNNV